MKKYDIEYQDHNSPENLEDEVSEETEVEISSITGRIEFIQLYTIGAVFSDRERACLWAKISDVNGVIEVSVMNCDEGTEVEVEMATIEGIQDIPVLAKEVEEAIKAYLETI